MVKIDANMGFLIYDRSASGQSKNTVILIFPAHDWHQHPERRDVDSKIHEYFLNNFVKIVNIHCVYERSLQ